MVSGSGVSILVEGVRLGAVAESVGAGISRVGLLARQSFGPKWMQLLGGSWVVISGFISPPIWVISIVTLLISPTYNYP